MAEKSQTRMARRQQKKKKKKPIWKRLFLIVSIVVLIMIIGVGSAFSYFIATAPKLDTAKLDEAFSSEIYDKDGKLIADLGEKQRKRISYDDLPDKLVDAVVATEDSRFFKHHGVDPRRIGGAVIGNFRNGFGSEGASTLTQQLVEKTYLTPEKKISLKVQEMWLALKLERKYSKQEILEMYLNKVYYGSGAYGVAKAAETYFGKTDLHDLTLPEAAILAGLPQRPTAYNPKEHPKLTKERMNTVLKLMVRHDKITQKQADKAKKTNIKKLLTDKKQKSTPHEAFIQQVRKEVKEKLDADIYTDGLKIYTTLDPDIQSHVEKLLSRDDDNPIQYPNKVEDPKTHKDVDLQAGMVVLGSDNGAVRAIGGGRDLKNDGFNHATQLKRQGGSNMKPLLAYGPAIENNQWSTYHQINDDKPFDISGKKVRNWDGQYHGDISMRHALAQSYNVPALKTVDETGIKASQKFGEKLGLDFGKDGMTIRDAIGGASYGTSPLEMAGAYRAFANEGVTGDSYTVTKVKFPDGRTEKLKPKQKSVMKDYTAYMLTDMMKTVLSSGTGVQANIPNMPVAGKTGTTNLENTDGSPDSWFSGYTTDYTISIWTGYDNNKMIIPKANEKAALQIFKNTMTYIEKDKKPANFKKPNSVVELGIEKGSKPATLPSDYTPDSKIVKELFVKGHEPSKKSEKYDKPDPVKNLKADYDKDSEKIKVKWDYDDDDASFDVSAAVDGGEKKKLSNTSDHSLEIDDVDAGSKYTIDVVAVNDDEKSDAKTTEIKIPGDKDEDDDEDMKPVSGLQASYADGTIDVSWDYDGPEAKFDVSVTPDGGSAQKQTVNSNGLKIDNAKAGKSYTIAVTPVNNKGDKGDTQTTSVSVPDDQNEDNHQDKESDSDHHTDDDKDDDDKNTSSVQSHDKDSDNDKSESQKDDQKHSDDQDDDHD